MITLPNTGAPIHPANLEVDFCALRYGLSVNTLMKKKSYDLVYSENAHCFERGECRICRLCCDGQSEMKMLNPIKELIGKKHNSRTKI